MKSKASLSDLQKGIHQALKIWHEPYIESSPLMYLNLFRQAQRQGKSSNRQITNQILFEALDVLSKTRKDEAALLRRRFLDGASVQIIANRLNVSEITVYRKQKAALDQLARVLQSMEDASQENRAAALEQRLERPIYDTLIGSAEYLDSLQQILASSASPWIVAIEGIGGIGKTSLADALSRRIIHDSAFDDFAWVSARRHIFNLSGGIRQVENPALTLDDLLKKILGQLEPETFQPFSLATPEALAILKKRFKQSPHLVVIDNLESVSDIETLLPALYDLSNPSKFLLTSRASSYYEFGIYHFNLPELGENDALSLIRREAKLRNRPCLQEAGNEDLKPVYQTVGGNPLALRLVVGQTHTHALKTILDDLAQARGQKTENLYTYIYRRAWDDLDEQTRLVFLAMPTVSPRGSNPDYLARVTDIEANNVRRALEYLVALNLVDSAGGLSERRYTIHNLTRTFLREQVAQWQ